jgi:hypothetical protein
MKMRMYHSLMCLADLGDPAARAMIRYAPYSAGAGKVYSNILLRALPDFDGVILFPFAIS